MSTSNVYNRLNAPTNEVLNSLVSAKSMDLLKKIRFDHGCGVSDSVVEDILRLGRFVCNNICYLSEEETTVLREKVIKISILKLNEL